jgi:hypothetical protein
VELRLRVLVALDDLLMQLREVIGGTGSPRGDSLMRLVKLPRLPE